MHAHIPGALSCCASWTDRPRTPSIFCMHSHAVFFAPPQLCFAQSTQMSCALHTSAHTARYACLNILSMIRGFCASPWPGHSVSGPYFIKTFFCAFCAEQSSSHQDILSGPHALHGLHHHMDFVSRPFASCALFSPSSFVAAHTDACQ